MDHMRILGTEPSSGVSPTNSEEGVRKWPDIIKLYCTQLLKRRHK